LDAMNALDGGDILLVLLVEMACLMAHLAHADIVAVV